MRASRNGGADGATSGGKNGADLEWIMNSILCDEHLVFISVHDVRQVVVRRSCETYCMMNVLRSRHKTAASCPFVNSSSLLVRGPTR